MVLWIGFAVLAAAVVWAVTRPLLTPTRGRCRGNDSELAVYRDQLAEIEAERRAGAARWRRGRRRARRARPASDPALRKKSRRATARQRNAPSRRARQVVIYAAAALPVIGIALYLAVGSPQLPAGPTRRASIRRCEQATAADLVASVEAHLREHPEDGRGWDVLAPVYMRMGDFTQAADAFQRAARLLGESPKRLAGFARAIIMLQNGIVNEPARQALREAARARAAVDRTAGMARHCARAGRRPKGAEAEYRTLLAGAEEPWKGLLEARLRALTRESSAPRPRRKQRRAGASAASRGMPRRSGA